MSYIWVVIIVIILIVENVYYNTKIRYKFKTPNTFDIHEIEVLDNDGDTVKNDVLIYNVSYSKELNKSYFDKYKYTYEPKMLLLTRLIKPVKESCKTFKNIDKDTAITDIAEGVVPYINYMDNMIQPSNSYKVLSNIPDLKITTDNEYVYIK